MTPAAERPRRNIDEQATLEAALREMFESTITFNQTLGLRVLSYDPLESKMRFDMKPAFIGHYHYGRLHGGVISAALDATAGFALMCAIGERFSHETSDQILARFTRIGTIDLRIDYLRPGLGEHFTTAAKVTRLGGRVGSVQMTMHNDLSLLIATGAGAYVIS
jgi:uncharacterized protein (TIGR00369 family)